MSSVWRVFSESRFYGGLLLRRPHLRSHWTKSKQFWKVYWAHPIGNKPDPSTASNIIQRKHLKNTNSSNATAATPTTTAFGPKASATTAALTSSKVAISSEATESPKKTVANQSAIRSCRRIAKKISVISFINRLLNNILIFLLFDFSETLAKANQKSNDGEEN